MKKYLTLTGVTAAALLWGTGPSYAQYVPPPQLAPGVNYNIANFANTPILTKFVDPLPGVKAAGAAIPGFYFNALTTKKNIPVAVATPFAADGSDYYEIALVDYTDTFHSELGPTKLRGYVQIEPPGATATPAGSLHVALTGITFPGGAQVYGYDKPSYLGPVIVATKGKPTRVKFYNLLPAGAAGNLFIPHDTTIDGAGIGPDGVTMFSQNRATLHLHGGDNPWISDGTANQWITPAGPVSVVTKGASQQNVPDMTPLPVTGDGTATFYWPNGQSARLMFYHDHALGITRLNPYAGEAAGYLLVDSTEGPLNAFAPGGEVPLVIQDKTFVSGPAPVATPAGFTGIAPLPTTDPAADPLWATQGPWGQTRGSLWFPHVYMPNQNPNDLSGANPFGRVDYGAWFWPVFPSLVPPVTSITPEAFMDTPIVNGTAYPYMDVQPTTYRFRILNACNDRFVNLQLYVADPTITTGPGVGKEVKMVDAQLVNTAGTVWPASWAVQTPGMIPDIIDGRPGGLPDPALRGPSMVQIGTEGGLMSTPVVLENIPVGYVQNKRDITVGSIGPDEHTLLLGCAERGDILIDFSQFAGKTIILYNDAPAPVPAGDPRYDYYTGDPDNTGTGGAPTTMPGFGPNTRTIMQFRVGGTANGTALDVAGLTTTLAAQYATTGLPAPIVPRGMTPGVNVARISDTSLTVNGVSKPLQPKAIQELFDQYGRMNATLGVEKPFTTSVIQTTIPYGMADPATEVLPDGDTQLWKITHNGVDTHAIHFHLFNVQVVNRVGWDGAIRLPEDNEMAWKDTVRMNPLEDIIVALSPKTPAVPFKLTNCVRPLDPALPANHMFTTTVDPNGNPVPAYPNATVNFGAEYTWHCHLLGHEENDMMRPIMVALTPEAPSTPVAAVTGTGNSRSVNLTWADNSFTATSFTVQRANDAAFTAGLVTTPLGKVTTFNDVIGGTALPLYYRVIAVNTVGSGVAGFPSASANSLPSGTGIAIGAAAPPTAPSGLTARVANMNPPTVALAWTDNSTTETGFQIQRATGNNGTFNTIFTTAANVTTYNDLNVTVGTTYRYRVRAINAAGNSAYSNIASVTVRISFVQARSADLPSASTLSVTLDGNQRAGNMNIVAVCWNDVTNNIVSVTDNRGNVYQKAIETRYAPGSGWRPSNAIFYAPNIAGGSTTVTVTFNRTAAYPDLLVTEYSGINVLDQVRGATTTSSTANSGARTTTAPNELIFGATTVVTMTTGPGQGFTQRLLTPDGDLAEDRIVSAIGSYSATAPIGPLNPNPMRTVIQMATFK
jgi:FtsP/CotA-like multicopper oxidase with cupredoxin domain